MHTALLTKYTEFSGKIGLLGAIFGQLDWLMPQNQSQIHT